MDRQDIRNVQDMIRHGRAADAAAFTRQLADERSNDLVAQAYHGAALLQAGEETAGAVHLETLLDRVAGRSGAAARDAQLVAHFALGTLHMRNNEPARVAAHLEACARLKPPSGETAAQLLMAYLRAGDFKSAKRWGEQTLRIKAQEGRCDAAEVVAPVRPQSFDAAAPRRNIIAMSLFGDNCYYLECAVTVARVLPAVFPEFTCRFYCGGDVPRPVLNALRAARAQVIEMPTGNDGKHPQYWGLFWRFLAFDDPEVDFVIVRDVDSIPIPRERAAIDVWLQSDLPFYAMRDHLINAEPLMAGMWGGVTGLLPPMAPMIDGFVKRSANRFADQDFLRLCVWPRIRDATLSIDSVYDIGRSTNMPSYAPVINMRCVGRAWHKEEIGDL